MSQPLFFAFRQRIGDQRITHLRTQRTLAAGHHHDKLSTALVGHALALGVPAALKQNDLAKRIAAIVDLIFKH